VRILVLLTLAFIVSPFPLSAETKNAAEKPKGEKQGLLKGETDRPASADSQPEAKTPPIKEIAKLALKESAFRPGRPPQPTVLKSEKDAVEYFAENALARLKTEVDFAQQIVVLFAWRGSGQDQMTFTVAESYPEQVTFSYKAGRTRDLRTHVRVYALRSNVTWSVAGAAPKPTVVKPAGGEVSWDEMKALIQKGQIQTVMQTHSRRVTVLTADGTKYEATEPAIDDVIKLIRESKKDIPIATE
jgi:hypothetical protein